METFLRSQKIDGQQKKWEIVNNQIIVLLFGKS